MIPDYHIHTAMCRHAEGIAREYEDDVRIILGIEADFIPDTLDATAEILRQYPFEYVISSVHIIGDRFGFDHPDMVGRLDAYGILRISLDKEEAFA